MSPAELDALVRRANDAGFRSIADHYAVLVDALVRISDAESGPWGALANEALRGRGRYGSHRG